MTDNLISLSSISKTDTGTGTSTSSVSTTSSGSHPTLLKILLPMAPQKLLMNADNPDNDNPDNNNLDKDKNKDNLDKDNPNKDPTAQATSNDVALGKEPVSFKESEAKKKNHLLTSKNGSLLESVNGISPVLIQVVFLRKVCVRQHMTGIGNSGSKPAFVDAVIEAKNNPPKPPPTTTVDKSAMLNQN